MPDLLTRFTLSLTAFEKSTGSPSVFAETSWDESEVWLLLMLLWLEVRKWHLALHSSTALAPPFPFTSRRAECGPWFG